MEEIYNSASYLEHLQFILIEFDPATVPMESIIIKYFEKGPKPSIKVKIDQNANHLDDYEELVAKAIKAKAKVGLRPSSYVQEADLQVFWESWPTLIITHKVQTQGAVTCGDESRTKVLAITPAQDSEPSDKSRKNKKKKQHRDKKDSREPKENSTTSVTRVKVAEVGGSEKTSKREKKNLSGVTCYNCNKKRHFANKCRESRRPKN